MGEMGSGTWGRPGSSTLTNQESLASQLQSLQQRLLREYRQVQVRVDREDTDWQIVFSSNVLFYSFTGWLRLCVF